MGIPMNFVIVEIEEWTQSQINVRVHHNQKLIDRHLQASNVDEH
jgi:hypothetical protein